MKLSNRQIAKLLHKIQLESVILTKVECNKVSGVRGLPKEPVSIDLNLESGCIEMNYETKKGTSFLEAKIIAKDRFSLLVRYEGDFRVEDDVDHGLFEYFLNIQAIPMLLGYVRETVDMLLLKMNEEGARLPIINVSDLFKNHLGKEN